MNANTKPEKQTETNVDKKPTQEMKVTTAGKLSDQERFNNARKALREYWNNK